MELLSDKHALIDKVIIYSFDVKSIVKKKLGAIIIPQSVSYISHTQIVKRYYISMILYFPICLPVWSTS